MNRDLEGKICIVTGANTGIGRVTALELARRGARVFVGSRSVEKGKQAVAEIAAESGNAEVEHLALDLASLDAVRRAADAFLARDLPLHLLVDNAGVAGQRGETADGFELHFGTNHLGHFLFTAMLLPSLRRGAPARVVSVASKVHFDAKGIDYELVRGATRTFAGLREYAVSKLANVLFIAELARRVPKSEVATYALHPGVVASDAWRRLPWPIRPLVTMTMLSNEDGAKTSLYCATSPDVANESGLYYDTAKRKEASRPARDPDLARELWEKSEAWTGVRVPPAAS